MKALFYASFLTLLAFAWSNRLSAQCTTDTYGQYPSTTFTPSCTGSAETITTVGYAGEYSVVGVTSGTMYTFTSSASGDVVTITNSSNTVQTFGTTSVMWTATFTGTVKFWTHLSGCGSSSSSRIRSVSCSSGGGGGGCTTDTYGQYPSTTFTPSCTGSAENITTLGYGGEYSVVSVTSGTMYTFTSSASGDIVTITNSSNTVQTFGTTSVMWTATFTGTVKFWTHTAGCGSSSSFRTRSVSCGGGGGSGCTNSTSFGSATIDPAGAETEISSCSYAGEYSTISGAVAGQTLKFTSSVGTDFITIHSGSSSGPIVAFGSTPLTFSNTYTGTLYAHWSTNSSCGTQSTCRITKVQCTSCYVPPCNAPGTPAASNVTTNSATVSWAAASGATSYDWSIGTSGSCPNGATTNTSSTSVNLSGLTPNTTYTFCVRTSTCGGGSATSYVSTTFTTAPLPNDACAGAITVTCGQTITGNTTGAASDSGLGSCGGYTPGNGIWYKLVGNGAQATISLCGSSYDTKLHVYSGTCGSLSCVTSNDDFCSLQSQVSFNALVGNTYYILVSGFSSNTGAFTMNITCLCGPALGAPWTVTNIGASNGSAIENVCDGTIDVKATNYGSPTNDVQTYAWQTLCGNGFIKAKLENVTNGGWGGIMFRESNAGGSKKIALRSQLTSSVVRDLRAMTNGVAQQQQFPRPNTPMWLRLTRSGNVFLGETSLDGVNWDFTFSTTLVLPNCIEVGLFAQSINVNTMTTAVFSNIMGVPTTLPPIPLVDAGNPGVEQSIRFGLFPNPAQNEVSVKLESFIGRKVNLTIYNNLGQVVLVRDIDEVFDGIERLPISNLSNGVYFVTLRSDGLPTQTEKLIVGAPRL